MPTLYVLEPGARIEKEYQRLLVTKHDEVLLRLPFSRITHVVLVGRVGVTTAALHALLRNNISLDMIRRTGKMIGRLQPPMVANLPLRQVQFRRNEDEEFALRFARMIVEGKIRNQRVMVQRLNRNHDHIDANHAIFKMKKAMEAALEAPSLDVLFGIEGQAARRYFQVYRKAFSQEWAFEKRTRRPSRDAINSLMNFGYTLLGHSMVAALEIVGLDPYLGYFHTEKYGRPALALDLIEEFRAPFVDSLVLTLINRGTIKKQDFIYNDSEQSLYLNQRGLRTFFDKFGQRMDSSIISRDLKRSISYRKLFEVQARKMAKFIKGDKDSYQPFRAR